MFYSNQNKDTIITNKNFANSYNNNGCSSCKKEDVATIEVIHKTYESLLASCTLSHAVFILFFLLFCAIGDVFFWHKIKTSNFL